MAALLYSLVERAETAMSRKKRSAVSPELAELAARLKDVEQEAEKAGLFVSHRPLLQCPACGLWEDVSFEGRLMTYFASDEGISDTGLRFKDVAKRFYCPFCHVFLEPSLDEE